MSTTSMRLSITKGKCLLTTTYQGKDNKYTRKWLYLTSVPLPFPQRTLDRRIDHFAQYLKDVPLRII